MTEINTVTQIRFEVDAVSKDDLEVTALNTAVRFFKVGEELISLDFEDVEGVSSNGRYVTWTAQVRATKLDHPPVALVAPPKPE